MALPLPRSQDESALRSLREESDAGAVATLPAPRAAPATRPRPATTPPRAWNVVLLDDNDHSYPYVALMVRQLFGRPAKACWEIARRVDKEGRAVCMTTHKELAELKQEQIHAFGPDPLIARCAGSMSAVIEPAECGDDAPENREGAGNASGGASRDT